MKRTDHWAPLMRILLVLALWAGPVCAGHVSSSYAFNCGSPDPFLSPAGTQFEADQPYTPQSGAGYIGGVQGLPGRGRVIIGGDEGLLDMLFTEHRGWTAYRFDLPNGMYAVQLHFIENEHHWRGRRRFSVAIEGVTVIDDLDIWDTVERNYALHFRFATAVTDGILDVTASAEVGESTLSAISIYPVTPDLAHPSQVSGLTGIGGYRMNILDWRLATEPDFQQFRVYRQTGGAGSFELVSPPMHTASRYIDRDVEPGTLCTYQVSAVDLWGNESTPSAPVSVAAVDHSASTLPIYEIEISDANMEELTRDIWADEYVPILFRHGGRVWNAEMRFRGDASRPLNKKNWKIRFPDSDPFFGRLRLNLQAEMSDQSMIRDRLGYQVYREMSSLTPNVEPVHLVINGEFFGVYHSIEEVDELFLAARGMDLSGSLYDSESDFQLLPDPASYEAAFEREINRDNLDFSDVISLVETVNQTPDNRIAGELLANINLDDFLNFYAGIIGSADPDAVFHNFFIYDDPISGRWHWINWDHNTCFFYDDLSILVGSEGHPSPILESWNRLYDRVLTTPSLRGAHVRRARDRMEGALEPSHLLALLEQFHGEIAFDAERDIRKYGWESPVRLYADTQRVRDFFPLRWNHLTADVASSEPNLGPAAEVLINEVMPVNTATIADEQGEFEPWVEILNIGATSVDLQGLYLTPDANDLTRWRFDAPTPLGAGERILVWADGEPAEGALHTNFTLSSEGGDDLTLVAADGMTILSQIALLAMDADRSLGTHPDGALNMVLSVRATPLAPNAGPLAPPQLRINEVQWDNPGVIHDESGDADPWIEIHNAAGLPISLDGMHLGIDASNPSAWAFPAGTVIAADGHLVVWLDGESTEGALHTDFRLMSSNRTLALFATDEVTRLDLFEASGSAPAGHSSGRFPDGGDQVLEMSRPTPGSANMATIPGGLVINEFLASNDSYGQDELGQFEDWVELHNPTGETIDAGGLWLTDDLSTPAQWQIPAVPESVIPPGGHLLIWLDGDPLEGPLHAPFRLSAGGEEIGLFESDAATVVDSFAFGLQITDAAVARMPSGDDIVVTTALPTPGQANRLRLTPAEVADYLLGWGIISIAEAAEVDANGDGVEDAADITRRIFLTSP